MDPRWQHPFTCIVAGPTGCGKTTFVARLLRNASAMIDPPPERVTWYYSEWQKAYENLADIPNMRLEEGLPTSFDNGKRGLVVLDDLCDSLALRLSSDRPQTEHARRHASTHVRTAGRCTPVGLRTEVGVNLLLTGVAYRLSVESCLVE